MGKRAPLIGHAASLDLVLEAVLVIVMLAITVAAHQLPDSLVWHGITPDSFIICGAWIAGLYLIGKARGHLPWQGHGEAPGGQRRRTQRQKKEKGAAGKSSTAWAIVIFLFAALATLAAGVVLQQTSETIAKRLGLSGVVFGATILDYPRFGYRGAMLDVARHFHPVATVKRYIDELAQYKINNLHLHLADDQGWRIQIDSWPRLTTVGGSTQVGGGAGGFYTKAQYTDLVNYALSRHITIIPEMIGARRNRANSPMKLNRRTGAVSTHHSSDAAKNDP